MIPDDAATKLAELARREFRAPRQQAAILILAGLQRAGLDPDQRSEEATEPPVAKPDRSQLASGAGVGAGQGPDEADDLPVGA